MENKYYIPDKTELHFGYECEDFNPLIMNVNNQYEKAILNESFDWEVLMSDQEYINNNLRTKYLDVQDIESLGWKYTGKSIDIWFEKEGDYELSTWNSNKAYLQYGLHDKRLTINFNDAGEKYQVFEGKCKSINELKKLLKMVM